ncbi:MAG: hypothetical protein O0X93_01575 [Methanocorpusculum sp.]|nr:hypothetical protein [Methanocorpusculum sp.]MDE2521835.1 hypothetical protein [Methanocorpusculum sp.]MDE2524828.1 hypothetical protein [Methanocorpusculum sp.]
MRDITTGDILAAAERHLQTHAYVQQRDVYYEMQLPCPTRKFGQRREVSLMRISRTLIKNGYVCIETRTSAYSKYAKPTA